MRSPLLLSALIAATFAVGPAAPGRAQTEQAQPAFATYADALAAGKKLWLQSKALEARAAFEAALRLAKTAQEQADARIGLAETYPRAGDFGEARAEYIKALAIPELPPASRVQALIGKAGTYLRSGFPSGTDVNGALGDLDAAAKVEGAPDPDRANALLQTANLRLRYGQTDLAQTSLAAALALPGITDDQKGQALSGTGSYRFQKKEFAKARELWSQILTLKTSNDAKVQAHRGVAQTYLAENQPEQAQAEVEKAAQLPGLSGGERARLYGELGDFQLGTGKFAAARTTYQKIVALPDGGAIQKLDAAINVGRTYAGEKNYPAARAEWEKLTSDAKSTQAVEALHLIALTHAEEKNYAAARAALDRWIALPQDDYWKEDAWLLLGQIHELETHWPEARTAYGKLTQSSNARSTRKIRAILGLVRAHTAEKNADAVLQDYALLPEAIKATRQRSPAETEELGQLQAGLTQHLGQVAAGYGKEKTSLPSAITLYQILGKLQSTDAERAAVYLELADLLFTNGMLDEAKVEYQKVAPLQFAGDVQKKKAAEKLREIEAKKAAG